MILMLENFHDSGVPLNVVVVLQSSELNCKEECSLNGTGWGQRSKTNDGELTFRSHYGRSTSSVQLPDSNHLLLGSPLIMGRDYDLLLASCGDTREWQRLLSERPPTVIVAA